MAYLCDFEDNQPGALVMTDLADGSTTVACRGHVAALIKGMYDEFDAAGVFAQQNAPEQAGTPEAGAPAPDGSADYAAGTPAPSTPVDPPAVDVPLPDETTGSGDAPASVPDTSPDPAPSQAEG